MSRHHVRGVLAALAAVVVSAGVAVSAQAGVGDMVTLTGTVVDSHGTPIAGQEVTVWLFTGPMTAITGDDGTYSIEYPAAADTEFPNVYVPGAQCDYVSPVQAPATVVINCVVPTMVTVTFQGTATGADGSSLAGELLSVMDSTYMYNVQGQIQQDGSFEIVASMPDTSPYLEIWGPGQPSYQYTGFVDGTVFSGLVLTFAPVVEPQDTDMTVTGQVTDRKGRAVAGAQVAVYNGYIGYNVETDAAGNYAMTGAWPWADGVLATGPVWVDVNGVTVDLVTELNPDVPTVVNYRIGKSPVFEPFAMGLDLGYAGQKTDISRKIDADKNAEWRVCTDGYCYGFAFGTKKTEMVATMPFDDFAGVQQVLLREKSGDSFSWYRVGPDEALNEQATFGPLHADGLEYFQFAADAGLSVVEWADKGGDTTLWSWAIADGLEGVQSTVVHGKFVSAEHRNLDGVGGDEMVLVTRSGNTYAVSLLASSTAEPVQVATGRGAPKVTYEDADGDGVFDIVASYPDRTEHRHHCAK